MGRTLILCDIHFGKLGSTIKSVSQLRPLWQGFDSLILNGDTAEMYSATHSEASKQLTQSLLETASHDGLQTTLIGGNHDPTFSETDHVWLCNKQILIFHGHVAFEGVAPWSWRSKYIAKSRKALLEKMEDSFNAQLDALRAASELSASGAFSQHRPSKLQLLLLTIPAVWNVLISWKQFPSLTEQWAATYAPSAKFIITGHTHHAGIWKRNGRVIINAGCFGFPSHPRAVVIDHQEITVHLLRKHQGIYTLGRVCTSWNDL